MDWNDRTKQMLLDAVMAIDNEFCDGVIFVCAFENGKMNSIAAMIPEVREKLLVRLQQIIEHLKQNEPIPVECLGPDGEDLRN